MIPWNEYYNAEMKRIEQNKERLEKLMLVIVLIFISTNVLFFIGATL